MQGTDRRGEWVAIFGAGLSLAGAILLAVLGVWSDHVSGSIWLGVFQFIATMGLWLLTVIQLHQQRLVAEEKLELAELERIRHEKLGGAQTIFEEEDLEQMEKLAMGRRLRAIERFLVPVMALGLAAFHVLVALMCLQPGWMWHFPPITEAAAQIAINDEVQHGLTVLICFLMGMSFVYFIFSRYALGMSRLASWSLLRAGSHYAFGSSAICILSALTLILKLNNVQAPERILTSFLLPFVFLLLAIETLINFVLNFYRPRQAGERQRPFYESRILGMFSEPGGILRGMAANLDYQFGFKVSETWFYKLLGRTMMWLLLAQAAVILALTCLLVVPPGHQAVIEHWGKPLESTAKPGLHLRCPWPMERATIIPVQRIQRMAVGYESEGNQAEMAGVPILWTKKHYAKEYQLLVADRSASANAKVPVNLLSINMPVQWRVRDDDAEVIRFHQQSRDVEAIVQSLAYRELTRYAAGTDVFDLMGAQGVAAAEYLKSAIQAACDHAGYDGNGLGVEIVYVGIGGIHPPPDEEVALTYENVVSAFETKDATIKKAEGDAAQTRITMAGSRWDELYQAILAEDEAREKGLPDAADRTRRVELLLSREIGGAARERSAAAERTTFGRVFNGKADAERYAIQLAAFRSAPETYKLRAYLQMMEAGLADVRKYVILLDDPDRVIYEVDLKPPAALDVVGADIASEETKAEMRK